MLGVGLVGLQQFKQSPNFQVAVGLGVERRYIGEDVTNRTRAPAAAQDSSVVSFALYWLNGRVYRISTI